MSQRNGNITGQQYAFSGLEFGFSESIAPALKADGHVTQEKNTG